MVDWTTAKPLSTKVNTKVVEPLTLYVHFPNGFRTHDLSVRMVGEGTRASHRDQTARWVSHCENMGRFSKSYFCFSNSYTERLQTPVSLHSFAGTSTESLRGQGTKIIYSDTSANDDNSFQNHIR